MKTLAVVLVELLALALMDVPVVQAAVPGSMEITCDVDRKLFRTTAKNEAQVTFRLWDGETGGSQCGSDHVVLTKDLLVFKARTDRFDAQRRRTFAQLRAVLGSDASPIQLCSGSETWLDVTVGTTTLTCDVSADDDPNNAPPPPARKRIHSAPFAQQLGLVRTCPPDSVAVGTTCVDKYEASVWSIPPSNTALIEKVKNGTATLSDLTGGGAAQVGATADDYGAGCPDNGQGCADLYAVSLPAVIPSSFITWFQGQQACANSRKRLPSNAEWQMAVSGTPDPGPDNGTTDCNTSSTTFVLPEDPVPTGSRSSCVSRWGAFDMVGNVNEWVADWVPLSTGSPGPGWGVFSNDFMVLSGASTVGTGPGAVDRGGGFFSGSGAGAGPLNVGGDARPSESPFGFGFRCVR